MPSPTDDDWNPRFNIAPTQPVPVIRQHPKEPVRELSSDAVGTHSLVVEGLVWCGRMINARSETAAHEACIS